MHTRKILLSGIVFLIVFFLIDCPPNTGIKKETAYDKNYIETGVKINVLLENYSISNQYTPKHGLSILIDLSGTQILLDVGPDNNFYKNAVKMDIDLTKVVYLFLSHNHNDHTGGINKFCQINTAASIFLRDDIDNRYGRKILFFNPTQKMKLDNENRSRITQLNDDLTIDERIHFVGNSINEYLKSDLNKNLYKLDNGKMIPDTFDHEGILVLEDNNELVIFNSCSHNGILNSIETVKEKFPEKRIRSYVGGLHFYDLWANENENNDYLDYLIDELEKMDITVYTGHCTGSYAINYLRDKLGAKIQEINIGMKLSI